MFAKRMFTLFALFTALTLAVFALGCAPQAKPIESKQKLAAFATRIPPPSQEPVAVVKAYYAAVRMHDPDTALMYLANDVVFLKKNSAPCAYEVAKGQHAAEGLLRYSNVLSFSVENIKADGNRVSYDVTAWLDPRIVGPNYTEPAKTHLLAVVEYGQIFSITQSTPPDSISLGSNSTDPSCG